MKKVNRHSDQVSIRNLKLSFLFWYIWTNSLIFFKRLGKSIPLFFVECYDCIKRKEWSWLIRIKFERRKEEKYWAIKFIFFALIFDIYWYGKDNENFHPLPPHLFIHLWVNSWRMVSLWGSCGTNSATIFMWSSTKKVYQTEIFKKLNPIRFLKKVAILQRVQEVDRIYADICDDPMNGCPEDFAEEGDRVTNRLMTTYYSL